MLDVQELVRAGALVEKLRARREVEDAALVERLVECATEAEGASGILTSGQAARRLGVSLQTIKNWAVAGRLPYSKMGERYLFASTDVEMLRTAIRARRAGAMANAPAATRPGGLSAGLPSDLVARYEALASVGDDLNEAGQEELRQLEERLVELARTLRTHVHRQGG